MFLDRVFKSFSKNPYASLEPLKATSSSRAAQMRDAIMAVESDEFSSQERQWFDRIETLRREMQQSEEILSAWDRPWLQTSPELRAKLKLNTDDKYTTALTKSKACAASKPYHWCKLLFAIVRQMKPHCVLEMGTNVGVSGMYIAAAMEVNDLGRLVTMEGSPSKVVLAQQNFHRLGLLSRMKAVVGDFNETLQGTIEAVQPIDLAFIDGFHDGPATVRYHEQLKPFLTDHAVLIYDDIVWSEGMKSAWEQITSDRETALALDLGDVGVWSRGGRGQVVRASHRF